MNSSTTLSYDHTVYQDAFKIYMTQLPTVLNMAYPKKDVKYLEKLISNHQTAIFKKCFEEMGKYIGSHGVSLRNGQPDEFKIIYFLGLALHDQVIEAGYAPYDANMFMIEATWLLNEFFAKKHPNEIFSRKTLAETIMKNIKNGDWLSAYGRYGIYMLFKCQSRLISKLAL